MLGDILVIWEVFLTPYLFIPLEFWMTLDHSGLFENNANVCLVLQKGHTCEGSKKGPQN